MCLVIRVISACFSESIDLRTRIAERRDGLIDYVSVHVFAIRERL